MKKEVTISLDENIIKYLRDECKITLVKFSTKINAVLERYIQESGGFKKNARS